MDDDDQVNPADIERSIELARANACANLVKGATRVEVIDNATIAAERLKKGKRRRSARRDSKTEARDKWIYEKACDLVPYDQIKRDLDTISATKEWNPIGTKQGIRDRAVKYSERHPELPQIPARQDNSL